jgi:hypothetical protein
MFEFLNVKLFLAKNQILKKTWTHEHIYNQSDVKVNFVENL